MKYLCPSCTGELSQLPPVPIYDPQPTRYEIIYRCDDCLMVYTEDYLIRLERELEEDSVSGESRAAVVLVDGMCAVVGDDELRPYHGQFTIEYRKGWSMLELEMEIANAIFERRPLVAALTIERIIEIR